MVTLCTSERASFEEELRRAPPWCHYRRAYHTFSSSDVLACVSVLVLTVSAGEDQPLAFRVRGVEHCLLPIQTATSRNGGHVIRNDLFSCL